MLPGRTHACQKSCRSNPTTLIQSRPRNYPECSCPTVPHSSCADSRFLVVLLTSCFLKQANASTKFPQSHSHSKLPQRRRQPILRTIGRRRPSNLRRHIPLDQRDKCNEVTSDGFFHSAVACEFSTQGLLGTRTLLLTKLRNTLAAYTTSRVKVLETGGFLHSSMIYAQRCGAHLCRHSFRL